MDLDALRRRLDRDLRRGCRVIGRETIQEPRCTRIVGPSAHPDDNLVMWSDLDADSADGVIAATIAAFRAAGKAFEWMLYAHDAPADLLARLRAHGGVERGRETVMVRRAEDAAAPVPVPGVELRVVRDAAGVADALAVQSAVWGGGPMDVLVRWLHHLRAEPAEASAIVVAYDRGRPVGSGWADTTRGKPFAPLFGGSVVPEARGRGIYRAMVAARATHARAQGVPWCLVDAGPQSRPILERLGFVRIAERIEGEFGA